MQPPRILARALGMDRPCDVNGVGGHHEESKQAPAHVDLVVRREPEALSRFLIGAWGDGVL